MGFTCTLCGRVIGSDNGDEGVVAPDADKCCDVCNVHVVSVIARPGRIAEVAKAIAARGPSFVCVLCGEASGGYGHNAAPLMGGECCDACNVRVVMYRLMVLYTERKDEGSRAGGTQAKGVSRRTDDTMADVVGVSRRNDVSMAGVTAGVTREGCKEEEMSGADGNWLITSDDEEAVERVEVEAWNQYKAKGCRKREAGVALEDGMDVDEEVVCVGVTCEFKCVLCDGVKRGRVYTPVPFGVDGEKCCGVCHGLVIKALVDDMDSDEELIGEKFVDLT